ncbi:hypothetical protein [Novosphingobium sp.]|uniref:hypothetical protein n=1 Tax=Novosphingobium sp. TaxID=1874826 RepID=UPI0026047F7E|nr:hypothetical protein [Novosphingobium sp.]
MRHEKLSRTITGGAIACAMVASATTSASAAPTCWSADLVRAAKLRQLDVMLMVGSLRCRSTGQDYRAAYDRFLLRHRPALGKANMAILGEMRGRLGSVGALDTLDRASVRMANRYGEQAGYGCGDLAEVTAALAESGGEALVSAAETLVGEDVALEACPVQVAVASLPVRRK